MEIKVLGSGCSCCKKTYATVEKVLKEKGIDAVLIKETDMGAIIAAGVMSTPAVVIDGKIVWAGGVPDSAQVQSWF